MQMYLDIHLCQFFCTNILWHWFLSVLKCENYLRNRIYSDIHTSFSTNISLLDIRLCQIYDMNIFGHSFMSKYFWMPHWFVTVVQGYWQNNILWCCLTWHPSKTNIFVWGYIKGCLCKVGLWLPWPEHLFFAKQNLHGSSKKVVCA